MAGPVSSASLQAFRPLTKPSMFTLAANAMSLNPKKVSCSASLTARVCHSLHSMLSAAAHVVSQEAPVSDQNHPIEGGGLGGCGGCGVAQ